MCVLGGVGGGHLRAMGLGLAETRTRKPQSALPPPHLSRSFCVRLWKNPGGEERPSLGKVGEHCPLSPSLPPRPGRGGELPGQTRGEATLPGTQRGGPAGVAGARAQDHCWAARWGPERTLGLRRAPLPPPCGSPRPYEPGSRPRAGAPPGVHLGHAVPARAGPSYRPPAPGRPRPTARACRGAGWRERGAGSQAPRPLRPRARPGSPPASVSKPWTPQGLSGAA